MAANSPLPPSASQIRHDEYEMVFEAHGTVHEVGGQRLQLSGPIRVIQGPKQATVTVLDDTTLVYAFVSVRDVNLPLLPNQRARRVSARQFEFDIPHRRFAIDLHPDTPEELLGELESVLKWFCIYENAAAAGTTAAGGPSAPHLTPGNTGPQGMLTSAGDAGVAFVEKVGDRINAAIGGRLGTSLDAARAQETRNVNVGGKATRTVLGGTRKVVGAGAGLASNVTEKASNVVGSALGNNPLMKNMRNAPENSKRFRFHETLMSGMCAVGRVYVAADEKGKTIITTTGDGTSEIMREKYGDGAARAARDSTRIAVDSYRIMRFPAKFGASTLLKGAAKANAAKMGGRK